MCCLQEIPGWENAIKNLMGGINCSLFTIQKRYLEDKIKEQHAMHRF